MINHHIHPDILMSYAAGNTSPEVSLVVASHLTVCSKCREDVATYEKLGGHIIENADVVSVNPDTISNIFDKIDNSVDMENDQPISKNFFDGIPRVLQKYLPSGNTLTENWKKALTGFKYFDINIGDSSSVVKMLSIPPGKKLPHHTHSGTEFTLVLQGGFKDETGSYDAGDVAIVDEKDSHTPIADKNEGCVCLVVYEGSLKFKGLFGPVLNYLKI